MKTVEGTNTLRPTAKEIEGSLIGKFFDSGSSSVRISDYEEIILSLLEEGASPNTENSKGITPLMLVAGWCSPEVIEECISKGADVDSKDSDGRTALHYLAEGNL